MNIQNLKQLFEEARELEIDLKSLINEINNLANRGNHE